MPTAPHDDAFPRDKGTYILLLQLDAAARLTIGRLGTFALKTGWYGYAGSAFGPGGLRGRLKHHLAPVARPHWHIDYLREAAIVCEIWWIANETRYEHQWADALRALPGMTMPLPRFGASDCKCDSHLVYCTQKLRFEDVASKLALEIRRFTMP